MTTAHNIDLPVLAGRLTTAIPSVRELLATFIHTLMMAPADALCGAGYGERSADAPIPATATDTVNSTPCRDFGS
ncbi:hypothetical protein [Mycolicibacterium aubagnense]|nr:hypothetical protein [Mycolicibacterium aubagnense]